MGGAVSTRGEVDGGAFEAAGWGAWDGAVGGDEVLESSADVCG